MSPGSRLFLCARTPLVVLAFTQPTACNDGGASVGDGSSSDTSSSSHGETTSADTHDTSSSSAAETVTSTDEASSAADETTSSSSGTGLPNVPPLTADDVFHTPAETMLAIDALAGVLGNDHDPEGDVLAIVDADTMSQAGAAVEVAPDGSFTYTPVAGFWGPDRFGYTAVDLQGASSSAEVVINVTPVQVELGDLLVDETHGFSIEGGAPDRMIGYPLCGFDDLDGDGLGDILIGAPARAYDDGGAYVVFGNADPTQVDLDAVVAGTGGLAIINHVSSIQTGTFARRAGDVDGDGIPDVVLGAAQYEANTEFAEIRSYVVFGTTDTTAIDLDEVIAGEGGFTITGEPQQPGHDLAMFADGIGDLDADGHDDVVIGIPAIAATGTSRTYVIYGRADTTAIDLADIAAGDGGFAIDGQPGAAAYGYQVMALGDVDGDGTRDLAITDPYYNDSRGRVYVVLGVAADSTIALGDVAAGIGGFVIDGTQTHDQAGWSTAGAGDVNGDGHDDIVLSAPYQGLGANGPGTVYVVFGADDPQSVALSTVAAGSGGFAIHGEVGTALYGVGGGGDFNGDGLADLAMTSHSTTDPNASGRAYVVYGTADTTAIDLADVALGQGGFVLDGEPMATGSYLGAVGFASDVDGDALDELLVGDPDGTPTPNAAIPGRVYVVRGASGAPY